MTKYYKKNSGVVISTVAWQQEGYGFEPVGQLWPFCVEFPCSLGF